MKLLIIGATSTIAQEAARFFARDSAEFCLVARNPEGLTSVCNDLRVRGATRIETILLDLDQLDRHAQMLQQAVTQLGGIDAVLIAHGSLRDQRQTQREVAEALRQLTTDCLSVISLATLVANYFEEQGQGRLAVLTSVAGDRGRQSNYVYGAAKGAVSLFLQGLRNRLHPTGVTVLTIKVGPTATRMSAASQRNIPLANPRRVGFGVYCSMRRRSGVVYVPWYWRWIMMAIKSIPEPLFKKLKL